MEVWHLSYALSQVPCSLVILESPHQQFIAPTPPNHSRVLQSKSLTCWIINPISYQHGPSPDWKFSDQKHANNDHFYPHKREYNLNKIVVGWRTRLPLCTKIFYQAEPPSGRTEYGFLFSSVQFSRSVLSDSVTPWTAARQASLSITNTRSLLKLTSIELVMPSNHLILCRPLLLPPSIFPNIRVFTRESVLRIRWPQYWSFKILI